MKYLSKVWLFTILIPPIIFWIIIGILKNEKISSYPLVLPILVTTMIVGFILSIPLIILSIILNQYITYKISEKWKIKMILNSLFVAGIITITLFIDEKSLFFNSKDTILPLSYLIVSSSSIWLFKYEHRQN